MQGTAKTDRQRQYLLNFQTDDCGSRTQLLRMPIDDLPHSEAVPSPLDGIGPRGLWTKPQSVKRRFSSDVFIRSKINAVILNVKNQPRGDWSTQFPPGMQTSLENEGGYR
ncbi:hypothetical protein T265_03506 [Opisthorchis viverrini]|uniref:Uncharacterized protein n=1 Tax=Opisthorchis viverrini TaxID=6198 RepID=A0A074ZSA8_OPIVI|nr:hypothetical protein T265_03506 [Opisthorchis viverrini]KER30026.1 hypothetical protein T265_03506 [Opisthorchis viverrini]